MKTLITVTLVLASFNAVAASNEQSFTPISVLKPIFEVSLVDTSDTSRQVRYYQCNSSDPANCMVDIQNQAQLDDLVQNTPRAGSAHDYDAITVRHCPSGTDNRGYTAYLKGEFSFNNSSQRYYTSGDADPITMEGPATETKVFFTGCQTTFKLPHTVNVGNKNVPSIRMFRMNEMLAYARLNAATATNTGCNEYQPLGFISQRHSVCMHNPEVYPYISSGPNAINPAVETYAISNSATANTAGATLSLIVDRNENAQDGTNVVAGVARRMFSFNSVPMRGEFNGNLNPAVDNADGATMVIENSAVRFNEFRRSPHNGTYSVVNSTNDATEAYFATPTGGSNKTSLPSYAQAE